MDLDGLHSAVAEGRVRWRIHALERMLARGISTSDVHHVLSSGEVLEDYADDSPYPSALLMSSPRDHAVHVVVAYCERSRRAYVITAYEPDEDHFLPGFRTRRSDA